MTSKSFLQSTVSSFSICLEGGLKYKWFQLNTSLVMHNLSESKYVSQKKVTLV